LPPSPPVPDSTTHLTLSLSPLLRYGLAFHPKKPFSICTTSRDTTVRFWKITGANEQLLYHAMKELSLGSGLGAGVPKIEVGDSGAAKLYGKESKALERLALKNLGRDSGGAELAGVMEQLFAFFGGDEGVDEFWTGALLCLGVGSGSPRHQQGGMFAGPGMPDPGSLKHILHKTESVKYMTAEAQNLESIRMRRNSMGGGIGGMKKDEQVRKAAETYAACGDLRKYVPPAAGRANARASTCERQPQGGFGGSPPDSPLACPLLPQESTSFALGPLAPPPSLARFYRRGAAAAPSSCFLRSSLLQP
jgi:hypothetical protein